MVQRLVHRLVTEINQFEISGAYNVLQWCLNLFNYDFFWKQIFCLHNCVLIKSLEMDINRITSYHSYLQLLTSLNHITIYFLAEEHKFIKIKQKPTQQSVSELWIKPLTLNVDQIIRSPCVDEVIRLSLES